MTNTDGFERMNAEKGQCHGSEYTPVTIKYFCRIGDSDMAEESPASKKNRLDT